MGRNGSKHTWKGCLLPWACGDKQLKQHGKTHPGGAGKRSGQVAAPGNFQTSRTPSKLLPGLLQHSSSTPALISRDQHLVPSDKEGSADARKAPTQQGGGCLQRLNPRLFLHPKAMFLRATQGRGVTVPNTTWLPPNLQDLQPNHCSVQLHVNLNRVGSPHQSKACAAS